MAGKRSDGRYLYRKVLQQKFTPGVRGGETGIMALTLECGHTERRRSFPEATWTRATCLMCGVEARHSKPSGQYP